MVKKCTVDEIFQQIGQIGRFQISKLAMFFFLMFPPTFQLLNMYFIAAEAPWQCVKNSTECKLNGSFAAGDDGYDFRCKINRSEWEYADYDGPKSSIISEFDLVCDDAVYGWLATSMIYIGSAAAAIPLGMISDRYGRLKTFYPCVLAIIIVGFASAFATEYWQFLVTRFVVGSMVLSVMLPIFVLSGEFVGPRYRPLSQNVMWFAFTTVLLVLALMAYVVRTRTWRILMILCTAPWIFVVLFWKFTPESIRWYMTHDKASQAEDELKAIAKANKKEYPEATLKEPTIPTKNVSCFTLFSSWALAIGFLTQAFGMFTIGIVYYGSSYGASNLGGNMYLNYALTSVIEMPANVLSIDSCQRIGRKKSVVGGMILAGIACFTVALIPGGTNRTDYIVGRVIGGTLAKFFIVVSYNSIYVWCGELLATVVRNSGMAVLSLVSHIGAMCAPFLVELKRIHPKLPYGTMAAMAVICGLCCLTLPETKGRPTVEIHENNNDHDQELFLNKTDKEEEATSV